MSKGLWKQVEYLEGTVETLTAELAAERKRWEEAEATLSRLQAMPEMDWARVTSTITQSLARLARTDQPEAKALLSALDQGKVYVDRIRARAEDAERERVRLAEHVKATINGPFGPEVVLLREGLNLTEWAERCMRAEADNAALLDGLRTAHDPHAFNTCHGTDCACGVVSLLDSAHPGAAMLERMRALEDALAGISTACETKDLRTVSTGEYAIEQQRKVIEHVWALARHALKEKP